MTDTAMVSRKSEGHEPERPALIDEQLADQLLGKAQAQGVELLGPDGLLSQVTRAVLERALTEEMTAHLGYEKHDPACVYLPGMARTVVNCNQTCNHMPVVGVVREAGSRWGGLRGRECLVAGLQRGRGLLHAGGDGLGRSTAGA